MVGEIILESVGEIIPEQVGDLLRNQHARSQSWPIARQVAGNLGQ